MLLGLVGLSFAVKWTPELMAQTLNEMPLQNYIDFLEPELQQLITKRQLGGPYVITAHSICLAQKPYWKPCFHLEAKLFYGAIDWWIGYDVFPLILAIWFLNTIHHSKPKDSKKLHNFRFSRWIIEFYFNCIIFVIIYQNGVK